MYEAIMIASTGIINQQKRIDTIAHNLSNVNTVGFKATRVDFKDALYTSGFGNVATPDGNLQKGHGLMVAGTTKLFDAGSILVTENMLDIAIEGEGFFEVLDQNGNLFYTRGGNFYISTSDEGMHLVTSSGYYVQNTDGESIVVPEGTTSVEIDPNGTIRFIGPEMMESDTFGIYDFVNPGGLSAIGSTGYEITVASGEKVPARATTTLKQGAVEGSNVNLATEMTRLVRAQRAFSLSARALTTADDMEGIANNLKK